MMIRLGISAGTVRLMGLILFAALGCASPTEPPVGVDGGLDTGLIDATPMGDARQPPAPDATVPEPPAIAHLHLHLLDIWGQPLPEDELRFSVTLDDGALLMDERAPGRI